MEGVIDDRLRCITFLKIEGLWMMDDFYAYV